MKCVGDGLCTVLAESENPALHNDKPQQIPAARSSNRGRQLATTSTKKGPAQRRPAVEANNDYWHPVNWIVSAVTVCPAVTFKAPPPLAVFFVASEGEQPGAMASTAYATGDVVFCV